MAFKKDGETKVFRKEIFGKNQDTETVVKRYTIDDLVKDSDKLETTDDEEFEDQDVSN